MTWDVELRPADGRETLGTPEEVSGRILEVYEELDFVSRGREMLKHNLAPWIDELVPKLQSQVGPDAARWAKQSAEYDQYHALLKRSDYNVEMVLPVVGEQVPVVLLRIRGTDTSARCVRKMCRKLRCRAIDLASNREIDLETDPCAGFKRQRDLAGAPAEPPFH